MMSFGSLILTSVPLERRYPLERAYSWLSERLREETGGKIDVKPGAVEHWVKGRRTPPGSTVGALATVLQWDDAQTADAVRRLAEAEGFPTPMKPAQAA